jgi:hypothetical protein
MQKRVAHPSHVYGHVDHRNSGQGNTSKPQQKSFWYRLHTPLLRDFQYAVQVATALVLSAIIGFVSDYEKHAPIAWLLPVCSALFIFDTFGGSLYGLVGLVIGTIPPSIFIYVIQRLGVGYHNYLSATLLFFFVTFYIGYTNLSITTRKIVLLLPVVVIPSLLQSPRSAIPPNFIWFLLGEMLVASCVSVAVSCFVFPRYASVELQDRFSFALSKLAQVMELSIQAMMATTQVESQSYLLETESLLKLLYENHDAMVQRNFFSKLEPQYLLRKVFRTHLVYENHSNLELVGISSTLLWHLYSMVQSVKEMNFHKFHAKITEETNTIFMTIAKKFQTVLHKIDSATCSKEEMDLEIQDLLETCDESYKILSLALKEAETLIHKSREDNDNELIHVKKEMTETFQELKAKAKQFQPPETLIEEETLESPLPSDSERAPLKDMKYSFDLDARIGGNRLTFSFFLFHLSETIHYLNSKFHSESETKTSQSPATVLTSTNSATVPQKPSLSLFGKLKMIVVVIFTSIYQFHFDDKKEIRLKTGLRTAVTLSVALIFIEVPILATKFENGQWILFAMLMSQGDNFGGNLFQIRLRWLGTMFGAIYSYFIYVAITNNNPSNEFIVGDTPTLYYILAMVVPFALLNGMIKQNKNWSYFGSISITTCMIVTFGRLPYHSPPPANYSLLRIQENLVGMLLLFVCSVITVPVLAIDEFKMNLIDVLKMFQLAKGKLWKIYDKVLLNGKIIEDRHVKGSDKSEGNTAENAENAEIISSPAPAESEVQLEDNYPEGAVAEFFDQPMENKEVNHGKPNIASSEGESSPENSRKIILSKATNQIQHENTLNDVYQLYLSQNIQFIHYIFQENMIIYQKLTQQQVLLTQSTFENYFLSPFTGRNNTFANSYHAYDGLLASQYEFIQLLKSLDSILIRLKQYIAIHIFPQSIMKLFLTKFSVEFHKLFELMNLMMKKLINKANSSILISNNSFWKMFSNRTEGNNSKPTEEELAKEKMEMKILIQELSLLSKKIYFMSHEFNHLLFSTWFSDLLIHSGLLIPHSYEFSEETHRSLKENELENWLVKQRDEEEEQQQEVREQSEVSEGSEEANLAGEAGFVDLEMGKINKNSQENEKSLNNEKKKKKKKKKLQITSAMVIHRLFDVFSAFNGLFYTSTHLAKTTIKLSSLIDNMLDMENDGNYKSF